MPQRKVQVEPLGEIILSKRRGTKNLRLSVTPKGQVRVSMPYWSPYALGVNFALSRKTWVLQQLETHRAKPIVAGTLVGKKHHVVFQTDKLANPVKISVKDEVIEVRSALPITDPVVQTKLAAACEKVLRSEAEQGLVPRTAELAQKNGFRYGSLRIRKLSSRWGSCSHKGDITLNYYLIQLPWELIDYVIIHELIHTKHLNHGPDFWAAFKEIMPNARGLQKQIRAYNPQIHID